MHLKPVALIFMGGDVDLNQGTGCQGQEQVRDRFSR